MSAHHSSEDQLKVRRHVAGLPLHLCIFLETSTLVAQGRPFDLLVSRFWSIFSQGPKGLALIFRSFGQVRGFKKTKGHRAVRMHLCSVVALVDKALVCVRSGIFGSFSVVGEPSCS